jgi:hypothetical protein
MNKAHTMKLIHLLAALGLVGALAAGCNSGPPLQGCDAPSLAFNPCSGLCARTPFSPPCAICEDDPLACDPAASGGGTGGTGGTAGTGGGTGGGGGTTGFCTNDEDSMTYDDLTYTTGGGVDETGSDAASAIASDCVFGAVNSDPRNPGCPAEAQAVLICAASGCPPATVQALTICVVDCMQDIIEQQTGGTLTQDCADCYGESVACSANLCATSGCSAPTSPSCIQCRCENDCTPGFDRCSGLPPSGDCG